MVGSADRNMCKDEQQGYCDPGRFMHLILTIVQAETPLGCWPEKAQQRVESLVARMETPTPVKKILNPFLSFNPANLDSDRNICKDEHQSYCDPGRFMLLILTIVQAETSFGCWPEKAQQRLESLVGESGNTNTNEDFKSCFVQ